MAKNILIVNNDQLFVGKEGKISETEEKFIDLTKITVIEVQAGYGDPNVNILGYNGDFQQKITLKMELKTFNISDLAYEYFDRFAKENLVNFGFIKLETNTPIWVKNTHPSNQIQKSIKERPIQVFYNNGTTWGVIAYNMILIGGVNFIVIGFISSVLGLILSGIAFFLFGLILANKVDSVKKKWKANREILQIQALFEKKK